MRYFNTLEYDPSCKTLFLINCFKTNYLDDAAFQIKFVHIKTIHETVRCSKQTINLLEQQEGCVMLRLFKLQ